MFTISLVDIMIKVFKHFKQSFAFLDKCRSETPFDRSTTRKEQNESLHGG